MAIDSSHPGCFTVGTRLFAVPSDTGHSVAETRASHVSVASLRRRHRRRLHWSVIVGGVAGGLLIDASAIRSSSLSDPVALTMMFVLGALVGFASAFGIREAVVGRPAVPEGVSLPAIEIPGDVARSAPDDATADELVLWSLVTKRFRAARIARDELPFAPDPSLFLGTSGPTPLRPPAEARALTELAYITARNDFEPVAELLGLPLPR